MPTRYHLTFRAGHPLATGRGFVHTHRIIMYELLGPDTQHCHWCGRSIEWLPEHQRDRVEIDHLDDNGRNNDPSNLVPSCHRCNITRSRTDLVADSEPSIVDKNGWRHRAVVRICESCGEEFLHLAAATGANRGRFCTRSCARKAPRRSRFNPRNSANAAASDSQPNAPTTDNPQENDRTMSETITEIEEMHNQKLENEDYWGSQDGFQITTSEQTIWMGIDNYQSCCEKWGYLLSEDDPQKFVGAELRAIVKTDTNRTITKIVADYDWEKSYNEEEIALDGGGAMFIDLETDRGVLQFVAYNAHNGYYGHDVTIRSRQLEASESL